MFSTQNTVAVTKAAIDQLISKGFIDGEQTEKWKGIDKLDAQEIVDLGELVNPNGDGTIEVNSAADIFFKALISQIGKIVVDTRSYVAQLPSLFIDEVNWGLISEHIMVDLSDVMVDEMWNPAGFIGWGEPGGPAEGARIAAIEFGCYKPAVKAMLYKKAHGVMVALTTARDQFFTSFRGVDEYNSFLAGLFNSVENTITVKAEIYALMTVSMGAAKARINGNEIGLCSEFKALGGADYTANPDKALLDADFLKFAMSRIAEVKDYIARYTTAYNNHDYATFASKPNTILLSKFANKAKFNVLADTYHAEMLGIGDYDKVCAWQAIRPEDTAAPDAGEAYSLAAAGTISLSDSAWSEAGGTESGNPDITNLVGIVYDRQAMGITVKKSKTTSQYSASRDTVNHFYHSLVNYVVNDNFPIVIFTLN